MAKVFLLTGFVFMKSHLCSSVPQTCMEQKKEKEREVKDFFEKKFCLGIEPGPPD